MTWDSDCSGLCLSSPPPFSFAETHHSQRGRADPLRRGRKDPCRAPHPAGRPDGLECGQGWPGPGSEAVLHSPHLDDTGGWCTRQQRRGNSSLCHAGHSYPPRLEVAMRRGGFYSRVKTQVPRVSGHSLPLLAMAGSSWGQTGPVFLHGFHLAV